MIKQNIQPGDGAWCPQSHHGSQLDGRGRTGKIRILIAEDHTVVRDGLVAILLPGLAASTD